MPSEIIVRCNESKDVLVIVCLANKVIQKLRPFVPPVSKQFRIIRTEDDGWPIQNLRKLFDLGDSCGKKMVRVIIGGLKRNFSIIRRLSATAAGNPIIFDANKTASIGGGQIR